MHYGTRHGSAPFGARCGLAPPPARGHRPLACAPTATPRSTRPCSAGAWERRADAPVALTEVAVAAHDDRVWVAGGLTGERSGLDRRARVRPGEPTPGPRGPNCPRPVHHSTLVSDGESLRLIGGYAGNGFDTPTAAVGGSTTQRRMGRRRAAARGARGRGRRLGRIADRVRGRCRAGRSVGRGLRVRGRGMEPGRAAGQGRASTSRSTSDGEGATYVVVGGRVGGLDGNLADGRPGPGHARPRRSASCRPHAAVSQRSGGRPSGRASSAGSHPAARTRRSSASTRTATSPCCLALRTHATGWVPRSSMAWPTSLLGGDQPGLFVSPTVESLELP